MKTDLKALETNLARVRAEVAAASERSGRDPDHVRICVATKYVDDDGLAMLRDAGVMIVGENRLQDMTAKQQRFREDFEWHFIGAIQSRKIREIAERVTTIHSLASESARARLADLPGEPPEVLVQVNVSGEESKQGVDPHNLDEFIAGSPVPISGLMTMPPATADPESARPYFAELRKLAVERGLSELSMGTSQDYAVAVEEGASLIRVGSVLFSPANK